ncbi:MAG: YraN family protein [Bdellovibrionaceae bacterium]|nr:YraN family protein [Pseudobdellovibrionaceae bacterium]
MSRQRQIRGKWAENWVQEYLQRRGYVMIAANLRTPWAQVDLVIESPRGRIFLLEVKFLSEAFSPEQRLGKIQEQRLGRARQFLSSVYGKPVGFGLAFVESTRKIRFFNLDDSSR